MSKIVLVGATGTIGSVVYSKLINNGHNVITTSLSGHLTDYSLDISDITSIMDVFKDISTFDALISTTGKVVFRDIDKLTQDDWQLSLNNKLLGQINLVQEGARYINKNGSFTLTTGILNVVPIKMGGTASTVNAGLEGFIKSASLEYDDFRINAVSPTVVKEALYKYASYFKGFVPVNAVDVANAYLKSISCDLNGEVLKVGF